jgi:outer membrane protein assembly factor BamB
VIWKAEGVGSGYSSVAVSGRLVFTLGDRDGSTFVFALDRATGRQAWSARIGKAGSGKQYTGSRSTPAVEGEQVFALSEVGELVCLATRTGAEKWRRNLVKDFSGRPSSFGYAESPLIDGNRVICTPGGARSTMVALDRATGKEVWSCPAEMTAAYSSAVAGKAAGTQQYVQLTEGGVLGVSAMDGKLLWKYPRLSGTPSNAVTPLFLGDGVFATAGFNKGGALLSLSAAAGGEVEVKEAYFKAELRNKYGGVTAVGAHLFGDEDSSGKVFCADWKTGAVLWQRAPGAGDGKGSASMTYADGHLYVLYESGHVALVQAAAKGYAESGSFKIPNAVGSQSRASPVVIGRRLYLREGDVVWCHDVAAK